MIETVCNKIILLDILLYQKQYVYWLIHIRKILWFIGANFWNKDLSSEARFMSVCVICEM